MMKVFDYKEVHTYKRNNKTTTIPVSGRVFARSLKDALDGYKSLRQLDNPYQTQITKTDLHDQVTSKLSYMKELS